MFGEIISPTAFAAGAGVPRVGISTMAMATRTAR